MLYVGSEQLHVPQPPLPIYQLQYDFFFTLVTFIYEFVDISCFNNFIIFLLFLLPGIFCLRFLSLKLKNVGNIQWYTYVNWTVTSQMNRIMPVFKVSTENHISPYQVHCSYSVFIRTLFHKWCFKNSFWWLVTIIKNCLKLLKFSFMFQKFCFICKVITFCI